jgi:hypothetical protein
MAPLVTSAGVALVWPALAHNELVISGAALIVACVLAPSAFSPHAAGRGRDGIGRGDSLRLAIDTSHGPTQPRSQCWGFFFANVRPHFRPLHQAAVAWPQLCWQWKRQQPA